jgi:hypothetical protein
MSTLSISAEVGEDGQKTDIVFDLSSGKALPSRGEAFRSIPRCVRDDGTHWPFIYAQIPELRVFDYDPLVLAWDRFFFVQGIADVDKTLTFVLEEQDPQTLTVVARHDTRKESTSRPQSFLYTQLDEKWYCVVLSIEYETKQQVLQVYDSYDSDGEPSYDTEQFNFPYLGEDPLMFLARNEVGFLDVEMARLGVLDFYFVDLISRQPRVVRFDPDPEGEFNLKFCVDTIALS